MKKSFDRVLIPLSFNTLNYIHFLLLLWQMIVWLNVFKICFSKTHIAITAVLSIKIVISFVLSTITSFLLAFLEPGGGLTMENDFIRYVKELYSSLERQILKSRRVCSFCSSGLSWLHSVFENTNKIIASQILSRWPWSSNSFLILIKILNVA